MTFVYVIALSSFLASITDWLCMDILIHRFYARSPEVWRANQGARRIVLSQLIGTVASAAAILLYARAPGQPVLLAVGLWCAGALPVTLQNLQWIKMSPAVAAGHASGWLARLLIATILAWWLLAK